jgi:hypothetical protein
MPKDTTDVRVRITYQFRRRDAMVYDLCCDDTRLTVQIAPRPNEDGLGGWSAEAHARQSPERPSVSQPGASRSEALRGVARSWAAKNGEYGFPMIDWESVERVLTAVRAL